MCSQFGQVTSEFREPPDKKQQDGREQAENRNDVHDCAESAQMRLQGSKDSASSEESHQSEDSLQSGI